MNFVFRTSTPSDKLSPSKIMPLAALQESTTGNTLWKAN